MFDQAGEGVCGEIAREALSEFPAARGRRRIAGALVIVDHVEVAQGGAEAARRLAPALRAAVKRLPSCRQGSWSDLTEASGHEVPFRTSCPSRSSQPSREIRSRLPSCAAACRARPSLAYWKFFGRDLRYPFVST